MEARTRSGISNSVNTLSLSEMGGFISFGGEMETLFEIPIGAAHPAKYTDVLLLSMAKMLKGKQRILDPFGGTGKVFLLERWLGDVEIQAVELEEPWAARHPRTTLGNAFHLPWVDGYFDAI